MKIAVIVGSTRPGRVGDQVGQWVMPVSYTHLDVYKRQGTPSNNHDG